MRFSRVKIRLSEDKIKKIKESVFKYFKGESMEIYIFGSRIDLTRKGGELIDEMTMLDVVDYAERLGFPIDEDLWMELRALRNSITHDYPDTYEEVAQALNRLNELLPVLNNSLEFFK